MKWRTIYGIELYACPNCGRVVSAKLTECPDCGEKFHEDYWDEDDER